FALPLEVPRGPDRPTFLDAPPLGIRNHVVRDLGHEGILPRTTPNSDLPPGDLIAMTSTMSVKRRDLIHILKITNSTSRSITLFAIIAPFAPFAIVARFA